MPLTELAGDDPSDLRSRTFVFDGEGHTLGNALRCIITRYPDVEFCGYTVPHPSENKINFRIQTRGPKAVDILRKAFIDLNEHSEYIASVLKKEVASYKQKHEGNTEV